MSVPQTLVKRVRETVWQKTSTRHHFTPDKDLKCAGQFLLYANYTSEMDVQKVRRTLQA